MKNVKRLRLFLRTTEGRKLLNESPDVIREAFEAWDTEDRSVHFEAMPVVITGDSSPSSCTFHNSALEEAAEVQFKTNGPPVMRNIVYTKDHHKWWKGDSTVCNGMRDPLPRPSTRGNFRSKYRGKQT